MAVADTLNIDPFDRPVPGQSLTAAPGSRLWEQPPQFANPQEAIEYTINKIDSREQARDEMLNLMQSGSPIEAIVNSIAFMGFSEGKWSPDVAELIKVPVTAYLVGLALDNDVDAQLFNVPPEERDTTRKEDLLRVMASNKPEEYDEMMNKIRMRQDEEDEMEMENLENDTAEINYNSRQTPIDLGGFVEKREV